MRPVRHHRIQSPLAGSRAAPRRRLAVRVSLVGAGFLTACSGPQSALDPAGRGAETVSALFGWMAGGALLIWAAVVLLSVYLIRMKPEAHSERGARLLILGGGVAFPTLALAVLLTFGLSLMPDLLSPPGSPELRVAVSGEQWWWRIRYEPADGEPVESANELRLPVGEPVEFVVTSPDVIHSFWIPSLGGKVDMIPGRTNHLTLEATRTGSFRGICAEYCGRAHALMAFRVIVMEREAFEAWLRRERSPAPEPAGELGRRGAEAFLANGCGACHTVRGTPADGRVGPDLTHVGGRSTLGAGTLPNGRDALRSWIARPAEIKPGVHMPAFGMLADDQLDAMAAYLDGLR